MNYNFTSGLFLTLVAAAASLLAYRLGLGTLREPGPGLIPFGTALLLGSMCMGLVVRGLIEGRGAGEGEAVFKGIRWGRLILVVCGLLGYGIALDTLGFSVSNFLFMALLLRFVGRKRWWVALVTSILIVVGTYLIFIAWLGSVFPRGLLGI